MSEYEAHAALRGFGVHLGTYEISRRAHTGKARTLDDAAMLIGGGTPQIQS